MALAEYRVLEQNIDGIPVLVCDSRYDYDKEAAERKWNKCKKFKNSSQEFLEGLNPKK